MSNSKLPECASLEYLKKLAKDRLQELRRADPQAKLATALLAVARDHGFSSWRALKAEIEQRQTRNTPPFFDAWAKKRRRGIARLAQIVGPHFPIHLCMHATTAGRDCTPRRRADT